jgi:hypothetical protein
MMLGRGESAIQLRNTCLTAARKKELARPAPNLFMRVIVAGARRLEEAEKPKILPKSRRRPSVSNLLWHAPQWKGRSTPTLRIMDMDVINNNSTDAALD